MKTATTRLTCAYSIAATALKGGRHDEAKRYARSNA